MSRSPYDIDDSLTPSFTRLVGAVKDNDEDLVRNLLEQYKINVVYQNNIRFYENDGILYHAVLNGNLKILEMLLQHGALANEISRIIRGPVIDYALKNKPECAEIMLRYGARCNINNYLLEASTETEKGRRKTHLYYRYADLEDRNDLGDSILHLCVKMKDIEGLIILVGRKVNVNQRSLCNGLTPLHVAAKMLSIPCLNLLLRYGADIGMRDEYGYGPLHLVIITDEPNNMDKQLEVMEWLLRSGADVNLKSNSNVSALHLASAMNSYNCMELLLRYGADPNIQDSRGRTPFFRLTDQQRSEGSEEDQVKLMQLLISAGADVNLANKEGMTPLHVLVGRTRELAVKLLISVGARINAQDENGYTPLHVLAKLPIDSRDKIKQVRTAQILLDAGADVSIVSSDEQTPLLCATEVRAHGVSRSLIKHMCLTESVSKAMPDKLNREAIFRNWKYVEYYCDCRDELVVMKSINFGRKSSLQDFLTRHPSKVMNDAAEDIYAIVFMNKDLKQRIKIWYGMLKRRYCEAMKRKSLMDNATVGLSMAMKIVEPKHLVVHDILKYLRNDDLVNLGLAAALQEKKLHLLPGGEN